MNSNIQKELLIPKSPDQVWAAIAESRGLAEWMYPNDFEPRVGHRFSFIVPAKPDVGFDGLTVHCEVLQCEPPKRLVFTWSAGELSNTQVSFILKPEGSGTRLFFQHSGFDTTRTLGKQAFYGADAGWTEMLSRLSVLAIEAENDE
ncbi:SRPBCC family protein [Allorhodopirellula solitaria]|uniref:Activator of Hsp90 ATPase homologue 1/2-like C-terminal domain-containing protein n=1 Tax=Allorhodopirellula solitaria TaxID=2527987 RepID=A0A5C5WX20_9BACT|nr:SRPBCC domain-containing protein [Allorhodopirellula solitaria]TWT55504.1 hypothetical protein CA85_49170 [Allorhodopirellula solitaria]